MHMRIYPVGFYKKNKKDKIKVRESRERERRRGEKTRCIMD